MSEQQQQREWLTAAQAAARLKVTERHVHRLAEDSKIERKRLGPRRILFKASDVERLAEETMVDLKPEPVRRDQAAVEALELFRRNSDQLADMRQQASNHGQTLDEIRRQQEQDRAALARIEAEAQRTRRLIIAGLVAVGVAIVVLAILVIIM